MKWKVELLYYDVWDPTFTFQVELPDGSKHLSAAKKKEDACLEAKVEWIAMVLWFQSFVSPGTLSKMDMSALKDRWGMLRGEVTIEKYYDRARAILKYLE